MAEITNGERNDFIAHYGFVDTNTTTAVPAGTSVIPCFFDDLIKHHLIWRRDQRIMVNVNMWIRAKRI